MKQLFASLVTLSILPVMWFSVVSKENEKNYCTDGYTVTRTNTYTGAKTEHGLNGDHAAKLCAMVKQFPRPAGR